MTWRRIILGESLVVQAPSGGRGQRLGEHCIIIKRARSSAGKSDGLLLADVMRNREVSTML